MTTGSIQEMKGKVQGECNDVSNDVTAPVLHSVVMLCITWQLDDRFKIYLCYICCMALLILHEITSTCSVISQLLAVS